MAQYVDGFVIVIAKKNLPAYKKLAAKAGKIWMEYGALSYYETVGDDLNTKFGVPFRKLTKAKPNEAVVFSYIVYKSKKHRDSVNKKVMEDNRIADMCPPENAPFDMKKMSYGGFETLVKY